MIFDQKALTCWVKAFCRRVFNTPISALRRRSIYQLTTAPSWDNPPVSLRSTAPLCTRGPLDGAVHRENTCVHRSGGYPKGTRSAALHCVRRPPLRSFAVRSVRGGVRAPRPTAVTPDLLRSPVPLGCRSGCLLHKGGFRVRSPAGRRGRCSPADGRFIPDRSPAPA